MTPRHKPGSKADRDSLLAELNAAGRSPSQIATEMRVRWNMRPREAFRHAHGWTIQNLTDRINDLATRRPDASLVADASLVGKWEKWPTGGRRPSLQSLALLAEAFGIPVLELLDLDDIRAIPEADLRVLRSGATPGPAESDASPLASPDRTTPSPEPAEPAPGPGLIRHAAAESEMWAQWAEATNVGDIALEQIMADISAIARDYLTSDPTLAFASARRRRDRVFRLLEGHQRPAQSADLYMAAGYLCGLLAWISSDLGQLTAADTQGRTAWLCAELAGHNDLRAWVLSTRSKIAFWDNRLRDAVQYARHGARLTAHGTVGILLACQEADAWSTLGAADEARAALVRADAAREQSDGSDDVGGLFSCGPYRQANYRAAVSLRLGEARTALDAAEQGIAGSRCQAIGTVAQMHISQASAYIALREPEGAAEALRPVLALSPAMRLGPVVQRMQDLAKVITASPAVSSPTAVALRRDLETWCLESATRRIALSPSATGG